MKKNNLQSTTLSIILSALLFSFPFFFLELLGFLILFFLIPLIYYFNLAIPDAWNIVLHGALWGIIVFGSHFIWLLNLLASKSHASFILAFSLYALLVAYYALTSAIWFVLMYMACKAVKNNTLIKSTKILVYTLTSSIIISITLIYFWFIHFYSTWFLDCTKGYPFLSPVIPLYKSLSYYFFLLAQFLYFSPTQSVKLQSPLICLTSHGHTVQIRTHEKNYKYKFAKLPLSSDWGIVSLNKNYTVSQASMQLYDAISSLPIQRWSQDYDEVFLLAPESAFQYPLNNLPNVLSLWNCVLAQNIHIILGAMRKEGQAVYQSVYWIYQGHIIETYDKKNLVDFTEKKPDFFDWLPSFFSSLNKLFDLKDKSLKCGTSNTFFALTPFLTIYPLLCSELFFSKHYAHQQTATLPIAYVNDSWFMPYYKELLSAQAEQTCYLNSQKLLYISYK